MKKIVLAFIFLLHINFSFSQAKKAQNELGAWYMYNGSHKLSEKFSLKSMAHFRFFEIGDDMQQFIGRLGGNYKINKNLSATVGYAFLNTDTTYALEKGDFNEHRAYEDFNVKHSINKLNLAHRFRAEQRFFNSTTGHFIRYQLALSYPLANKWSTYIYDEIFFDFNGEAYNQNWIGAGFKYQLSNTIKLQAGYMSININNTNFNRIQLGVIINTNHIKNKK